MSAGTCLTDLRARKLISEATFERLRPQYEELVAQYEGMHGRGAAESMATQRVLELAEEDTLQRKRQAMLQAKAQGEFTAQLRQRRGDPRGQRIFTEEFFVAMDGLRRSVRDQALQMNAELLGQLRKTLRGKVRDPVLMEQVVSEIHGTPSGNAAAKGMAEAWRQVHEMLRSRFNAAGGAIGKLESWHLPQRHDMRLVRDAGFPAWRDFVKPLLDRKAMLDRATGLPMSDERLELVLREAFDSIETDGWNRNNPGQMFEGAIANRRASHRVLHFADGESWTAYAERFGGGGGAQDAMISHIEGMARDIAAMETMGPNPSATLRFMSETLEKEGKTSGLTGREADKAADQLSVAAGRAERLYNEYSGANSVPENRRLAMGFSIFRAQQTAAKLGGAMLSVGGDYGLMAHNAGFNGFSGAKVMARYFSMLNPANTADRAQAARYVLMADQWADSHAAQWRTLGEELTHEGARLMATGVLRASGLVKHTDIARQAFGMELVSHMTHQRERSYGQMDEAFRSLLARYNIDETRWDTLRRVQPDSHKGTDWIYPETVAKAGHQDIADDFMRMITTEADYAVPVPDIRTRAFINSSFRKGTALGEVVRSGFLFKGFPMTVINLHGRRMLEQGMGKAEVGAFITKMLVMRYGLSVAALTTLGGAVSLQAKSLAYGKDPEDMSDARFWTQALLQGGGLGIFGDFLFAGENRFGGGVAETITGPAGQTADTLLEIGKTPFRQLDDDEANDDHWKRAVAKVLTREVPGINLWQTRQLVDRTWGDMLTEWAYGDDVEARYRRLEQYANERGTSYYSTPGEGIGGGRAIDWANALGRGEPGAVEAVPLGAPE